MPAINICPTCGSARAPKLSLKDILEEKLAIIKDFSTEHPEFDTEFTDSLAAQLKENGQLSPKQIAALNNIIERYRME